MIKLICTRTDTTVSGFAVGEGFALDVIGAAQMIARGVASLAPGEIESEELRLAIAAARRHPNLQWLLPLIDRRRGWHLFDHNGVFRGRG